MSRRQAPKVLIVGLDGATFDLVRPWAVEGRLPTFQRLLGEGVHADLRSTFPPVTAPAWTSFMTGKNPGKHGLFHFIEPQPGRYELRYTNARSRAARSLWAIAGAAGLRVGAINVPMTYPPETVNGFLLAGMDAPQGSRAVTSPPELYDEIERELKRVSVQLQYLGFLKTDERRDALLRDLADMDQHYRRMTDFLLAAHPVDLAMVVFTSTDTVQHFFYQYVDPQHPQHDAAGTQKYRDAIFDVYRRLDGYLAEWLERLPEDGSLVVMSDHGFRSTSGRVLHLNRFLADAGFLRRREESAVSRLRRRVMGGVDSFLRGNLTPQGKARIARMVPGLRRRWEAHYGGLTDIDWAGTQAFAYEVLTYPPGIWINRKGVFPEGTVADGREYEDVVARLTARLLEIRDPATGKPLISRVYRREEIYSGPLVERAPDLTLAWWEGITFVGKPGFSDAAAVEYRGGKPLEAGEWGGGHALDGILALHGPRFRRGVRLDRAEIIDVAPTILHLLGLPVPEDMDGRVLLEAFTDAARAGGGVASGRGDSAADLATSAETYSDDEAAKVEERLRGLGYLD